MAEAQEGRGVSEPGRTNTREQSMFLFITSVMQFGDVLPIRLLFGKCIDHASQMFVERQWPFIDLELHFNKLAPTKYIG